MPLTDSQLEQALGMAGLRHNRTNRGGSRMPQKDVGGVGNRVTRSSAQRTVPAEASHSQTTMDGDASQPQRSMSDSRNNSSCPLSQNGYASQPNSDVSPPQHQPERRGRKRRATTELKIARRGRKVGLVPNGDRQFRYSDYHSTDYKYTTQLGVILKREYPGRIEEKNDDGNDIVRPALEWDDYYHKCTENEAGQTAADRVKNLFWDLFEVYVNEEEEADQVEDEADRVFEKYARKKVKDIMYQVRVDAVKLYYENQGELVDEKFACPRELEYDQYLESRIEWIREHAWPLLCNYWCSREYKNKRRLGQESRLKSNDVAQNRGGSRPFVETQQYLDDYCAMARDAHPDDWEQRDLDANALYRTMGGVPHGRVAIADGAVRKEDVISAGRQRNVRPPSYLSRVRTTQENEELKRVREELKRANEENERLRQNNERLEQKQERHEQYILTLFREIGRELPEGLQPGISAQPHGTNSSHAGSQGIDGNTHGRECGANIVNGDHSANLGSNTTSARAGTNSSNNHENQNLVP